jgi:hypothetical protein
MLSLQVMLPHFIVSIISSLPGHGIFCVNLTTAAKQALVHACCCSGSSGGGDRCVLITGVKYQPRNTCASAQPSILLRLRVSAAYVVLIAFDQQQTLCWVAFDQQQTLCWVAFDQQQTLSIDCQGSSAAVHYSTTAAQFEHMFGSFIYPSLNSATVLSKIICRACASKLRLLVCLVCVFCFADQV